MLFRLKPEDFPGSKAEPAPRPRQAPAVGLSDFSPEEWNIIREVAADMSEGGRPPGGASQAADYCRELHRKLVMPTGDGRVPATRLALRKDRRAGVAALEFALVAPLFILLILGIIVYGGWFWLAHSVQSLASESARAAIAGLDAAEQRDLAETFVARRGGPELGLAAERTTVSFRSDAEALTVSVAYDSSAHPLIALAGPLPRPPAVITRSAVVRTGGY